MISMDTNDRYVVKEGCELGGYFGTVVDSLTGNELCSADSCEAPEDATVYRAFKPLLTEMNRLARQVEELKARVRELETPMPAWEIIP